VVSREQVIVNLSSVNARQPDPGVADYSAAKAAVTNLTKVVAQEFTAQGAVGCVPRLLYGTTRYPRFRSHASLWWASAIETVLLPRAVIEGLRRTNVTNVIGAGERGE
jgi:NAD(P)-dependent dehydrogenase (short-subunit alcohol dehydrogenase family)